MFLDGEALWRKWCGKAGLQVELLTEKLTRLTLLRLRTLSFPSEFFFFLSQMFLAVGASDADATVALGDFLLLST
jgi:hypothetical protein